MTEQQLNGQQRAFVDRLQREFGVDPKRVMFFEDGEAWLPSDVRITIARQRGGFASIDEDYFSYIEGLGQVVHKAHVVDKEGVHYGFCGVATIGERLPNGEEADPHDLAGSRALVKALRAAGVDERHTAQGELRLPPLGRTTDIQRIHIQARIHIRARRAGLITGSGKGLHDQKYRDWLDEHYGVNSSVKLTQEQRASAIKALEQLEEGEFLD